MMLNPVLLSKQITLLHDHFYSDIVTYGILCSSSGYPSAHLNDLYLFIICCFCIYLNEEIHNLLVYWIRVITKLPNFEQSYKGKVKTHKYIKTKSVNNRKTVKTVMTLTWYRHFKRRQICYPKFDYNNMKTQCFIKPEGLTGKPPAFE